jgi:hypothetical protein
MFPETGNAGAQFVITPPQLSRKQHSMNLKIRVHRALAAVVVATSVAMSVGATSAVQADNGDGAPPSTEPVEAVSTTTIPPTTTTIPPATSPPSTDAGVASAVTDAAPTTPQPAAKAPSTTQPPSAVATTTTLLPVDDAGQLSLLAATVASAPRSLVATPGNASVKLTWLRPASTGRAAINKYRVQRARAGGPWKNIAYPTTRHHTATGLVNSTRYYFRIAAHNAAGWSKPSTAVNAVPRTVPTAPRSPTATPGNASVKLTWLPPASNGGAAIDKYLVQRSTNGTTWANVGSPTGLSSTATGLVNGTKYYFRVRAHNSAGFGAFSTIVTAVPFITPTAPASCSAAQYNGPGTHEMLIQWASSPSDGVSPAAFYEVDATMNGVNSGHGFQPPGSGFVVWQVPYGWYEVRVWAVNAAGPGPSCTTWVMMWWP